MTDNSSSKNNEVEHLRWLIDIQLENLRSFRTRTLEILGFNSVILVFLWTLLDDSFSFGSKILIKDTSFFVIFLISLLVLIQLLLFIWISIPRKSEQSLQVEKDNEARIKNLEDYYGQISEYVGNRANSTRNFYRLFIAQILLFIIGIINQLDFIPTWILMIFIGLLIIIVLIVLFIPEKFIL